MSTLHVKVSIIDDIYDHPNADRLSVVKVNGWEMIVPKGQFKVGDKCVPLFYDTCLTDEIANKLGVKKYLKGKDQNRIGRTNLRGLPSFGVVAPVFDHNWSIGKDVAKEYGASKYEPPVKQPRFGGTVCQPARQNPLLRKYTDIENFRHYSDIIKEGEEVWITEKLDGSSSRLAMIDGEVMCGSRNLQRKVPGLEEQYYRQKQTWFGKIKNWFVEHFTTPKIDLEKAKENWWWYPYTLESVRNFLNDYSHEHKQVIIFGETFGKVQKLNYGLDKLEWRAYDIMIDSKWLDYSEFIEICNKYQIPHVPVLYHGAFSVDLLKQLSKGNTTLNGSPHIREGVVIRPAKERIDNKLGRVLLKYINDDYLLDKKLEEADATDN